MSQATVFLDTNIFLHYQPFDQIRWAKELKCRKVTLILSQIVVHELDRKKDEHHNARIRNRARTTLSKLEEIIEAGGQVDAHVALQYEESTPTIDYAALRLDRSRSDDQIIASVYVHRASHQGQRVLIVTNDTGLILKCRVHNIEAVRLREALYVPDQADPDRQRIKELEAENSALRQATLELSLALRSGGNRVEFTLQPELPVSKEVAQSWVTTEIVPRVQQPVPVPASTIEKLGAVGPDLNMTNWSQVLAAIALTWNDQQRRSIEQFYAECMRYHLAWTEHQNAERRTCRLALAVSNSGRAVAEDVYVFLKFPTTIEVFGDGKMPLGPKPPAADRVRLADPPPTVQPASTKLVQRQVSAKLISNLIVGSHREICYHLSKVQHHVGEWLPLVGIRFYSHLAADSITIPYRITTVNAPTPVDGELIVEVVRPVSVKRRIARRK